MGKELTIDARVEDWMEAASVSLLMFRIEKGVTRTPIPVLLGNVRDEPRETLAVELDFGADATLHEPVGIDKIAVKLKPGVVEDAGLGERDFFRTDRKL